MRQHIKQEIMRLNKIYNILEKIQHAQIVEISEYVEEAMRYIHSEHLQLLRLKREILKSELPK